VSRNTIASLPNSFPGAVLIVTKTLSYSQFGHIPIARCSITSWRNFSWPFKSRLVPTCGGCLGTTRSHRRRLRLRLCTTRWIRIAMDALLKKKKKTDNATRQAEKYEPCLSLGKLDGQKNTRRYYVIYDSSADRGRQLYAQKYGNERKKFLSGCYYGDDCSVIVPRFFRIIRASDSRTIVVKKSVFIITVYCNIIWSL